MAGMLGKNIDPSYWLWDFDENKIWLGSSTVVALESVYVPFRLYDPARVKDVRQITPEDRPELWQMIGTFEPSQEQAHVYHVKFNMQFFMAMAGYPLAQLELRMGIANNGDGTLYIGTMKGHPSDKDPLHYFNAHAVYNGNTGQRDTAPYHNYLLGTVLPGMGDRGDADRTLPAYNSFVPFRASPLFGSTRMAKVDKTETCANDLPVTFYREFLRLSGDKDTVCSAIPVVNGKLDSDADGFSDIAEIAGRASDETERQGVRDGGYVMPIKCDSQYDFLQPEALWRKPWFAGLISLGNGERAVLYTRHEDSEANALTLGDHRKAIPGFVWEPVPKVFFGEADPMYLPTPATSRLPVRQEFVWYGRDCISDPPYELGSIRLPSVVNNADREGWFYLYFNKGIPEGLQLYELAGPRLWDNDFLGQDKWNIDEFRIQWQRLADENDPGYDTTVRFKIPTSSVYGTMTTQVAMSYQRFDFFGDACPAEEDTQPRTDVAFDAEEPGYVALMEKAERWTYEPPATASVWLFYLNGRERNEITVTPGSDVTFSWSVNNTHQCAITKADWSELDGAEATEWKNAADSWTSPVFDRTGTYTYQLVCDPGFAVGEEPDVITVRVVTESSGSNNPPPTYGAGTRPGSGGSAGYGLLLLLGAGLLRSIRRPAHRRRAGKAGC